MELSVWLIGNSWSVQCYSCYLWYTKSIFKIDVFQSSIVALGLVCSSFASLSFFVREALLSSILPFLFQFANRQICIKLASNRGGANNRGRDSIFIPIISDQSYALCKKKIFLPNFWKFELWPWPNNLLRYTYDMKVMWWWREHQTVWRQSFSIQSYLDRVKEMLR